MTIYTATNNWIPQGNRLTRAFQSGLVLIQQDYIAPTGTPPSATLAVGQPFPGNTSPCFDGAFIFPAPGFQDNGNGFTTCTVTAYGRLNTIGNKTFTRTLSEYTAQWTTQNLNTSASPQLNTKTIPTISDQLLFTFVKPARSLQNIEVNDAMQIYRVSGQALNPVFISEFFNTNLYNTTGAALQISKPTKKVLTRAECVNFGAFDEWTVVYSADFEDPVFDFGVFYKISAPTSEDQTIIRQIKSPIDNVLYDEFTRHINDGSSASPQIVKIWNIDAPSGGAGGNQQAEMAQNADNNTFRGGILRRNNTTTSIDPPITYFPPQVGPRPSQISQQATLPPPAPITRGSFTWEPQLNTNASDNQFSVYTFHLQNSPVCEVFQIDLSNELNQTSSFLVQINFVDPD